MKNTKSISALCLVIIGFASAVMALDSKDVVTGPGNQPIRSGKFGNCVQTKWSTPSDPCATEPPAKVEIAPVPVPPVVEPVTRLEHEELKIYFDFNKSVLTPGAKVKLDQIADAVNKSPHVIKVGIVGYTDEIGSNSYNDTLSVKRAQAVKAYLDTKMRIDSSVLGLRGLGKQDPVVDCSKTKKRAKKIDCMAKDRRVEIEFEFQK